MLGATEFLELDYQYKIWKNKLIYLEKELSIIHERALELTLVYSDIEEPLFDMQKGNIETCIRKIKIQEEMMSVYAIDFPINSKHEIMIGHDAICKSIDAIETVQAGLAKKVQSK